MTVLGAADFDSICRTWYNRPGAFAIRDQHKDVPAYNWSCYEPGPVAPDISPAATTVLAVTPSLLTLRLRLGKDWAALVNTSAAPLSLDGVEFRRAGRTLIAAQAWGRKLLMPGECLRMYSGPKAPKDSPVGCSNVLDYNADKKEREAWFTDQVMIAINPSTTYCYPSEKC